MTKRLASVAALVCFAFACRRGAAAPNCTSDEACLPDASASYCVEGRCARCRTAIDCATGERCRDGACEPRVASGEADAAASEASVDSSR